MSTALAAQLQKLAAQPTAATTRVASLLFDSREASDLDLDTIFALGTNGFVELCTLSPKFDRFEKMLFSPSVKDFDRTLQTAEVNARLDENIQHFLQLLSSYFLLKPAHKVLEWLLRRFRINEFNIDAIMQCILPYHETNLFVRVVQLLQIKSPRWQFLTNIRKSGSPLARATLSQRCISDPSLLQFICQSVQTVVAQNTSTTWITFYVTILITYIRAIPKIDDQALQGVLPYLLHGLKAKESNDYQVGTYMILGQLAAKVSMSADLTATLLSHVCRFVVAPSENTVATKSVKDALLCVLLLVQSQQPQTLPDDVFKSLISFNNFLEDLAGLSEQYDTTLFLRLLVTHLAQLHDDQNASNTLVDIARRIRLTPTTVELLINETLNNFLSLPDASERNESVLALLNVLQSKYPQELDRVIDQQLKASADSPDRNKKLFGFISSAFKGTRHEPILKTSTTLFLSSQHPDPKVRLLALQNIAQLRTNPDQAEFVRDLILARLLDDNEKVVAFVLSIDNVTDLVPHHDFASTLLARVQQGLQDKIAIESAIAVLVKLLGDTHLQPQDHTLIERFLLQNLLPATKSHHLVQHVYGLLSTAGVGNQSRFSLSPDQDWANTPIKDAITAVIKQLAAHVVGRSKATALFSTYLDDLEDLMNSNSIIKNQASERAAITIVLVLAQVWIDLKPKSFGTTAAEFGTRFISLIERLWQQLSPRIRSHNDANSLNTTLVNIATQQLDHRSQLSQLVLEQVVSHTSTVTLPAVIIMAVAVFQTRLTVNEDAITRRVFGLLSVQSSVACLRVLLQALFSVTLKGRELAFLTSLFVVDIVDVPALVQTAALHLTDTYLSARFTDATQQDPQLVIAPLIVAASSPSKAVRGAAIACFGTLSQIYANLSSASTPASSSRKKKKVDVPAVTFVELFSAEPRTALFAKFASAQQLVVHFTKSTLEITEDEGHASRALHDFFIKASENEEEEEGNEEHISVLDMLLTVAQVLPSRFAQIRLLVSLEKVLLSRKLSLIQPLLESTLDSLTRTPPSTAEDDRLELLQHLLKCFTPATAASLSSQSEEEASVAEWQQLLKCIQLSAPIPQDENSQPITPQQLALGQINKAFYAQLPEPSQQELFSLLCKLAATTTQPTASFVKRCLRSISLHPNVFVRELEGVQTDIAATLNPPPQASAKKRKKKEDEVVSTTETTAVSEATLDRLITVLEVLEMVRDSKDGNDAMDLDQPHQTLWLEHSKTLVPALFDVLSSVLHLHANVPLEYVKQLLLSCLLSLISALSITSKLDQRHFRVDIVVQCIRGSDSPQTHQHALLLLASIASLHPEQVLANIMPIFTFMGANVLRQDDHYSFTVIKQTVERILPPLVANHHPTAVAKQYQEVKPVLKVFVDALFHIPKHRRLRLFSVLVSTLGEEQYLHAVCCLLLEHSVEVHKKGVEEEGNGNGNNVANDAVASNGDADSVQTFCNTLVSHFSMSTALQGLVNMIRHINQLPMEPPTKEASSIKAYLNNTDHLFDARTHTSKQLRQYRMACLEWVHQALTSRHFHTSPPQDQQSVDSATAEDKLLLPLLEQLLLLITSTSSSSSSHVNSSSASSASSVLSPTSSSSSSDQSSVTARFWKAFLSKTADVVQQVNEMLSIPAFVSVIARLINHPNQLIRRKALNLLDRRVLSLSASELNDSHARLFVAMLPDLQKLLEQSEARNEGAVNKQAVLLSLEILVRQFASASPAPFLAVLPTVLAVATNTTNRAVIATAFVCLASACTALGASFLPHLPSVIQSALKTVQTALNSEEASESNSFVIRSVVTLLEESLSALPQFMSSYLGQIVQVCLHPALVLTPSQRRLDDANSSTIAQSAKKASSTLTLIATKIPARAALPALFDLFTKLSSAPHPKVGLVGLFSVLAQTIHRLDRSEIITHHQQIATFFISTLSVRYRAYSKTDGIALLDVDEIEVAQTDAFLELVMKLNETLFKPLLVKVIAWRDGVGDGVSEDNADVRLARSVTFYRLIDRMLDKLKSIFVPYSSYVYDGYLSSLIQFATMQPSKPSSSSKDKKRRTSQLATSESNQVQVVVENLILTEQRAQWRAILSGLTKCFRYDTDGVFDRERLEKIVDPAVNQLEAPLILEETPELYLEEVRNYVVPSLAQLAVTAGTEAIWKPLNNKVLLKTRSTHAHVRFGALLVMKELYSRLAEEFLVLLPETIPFLAELLEDEDETVEKSCQELISTIEQVLGEPIKKYFQ